MGYRDGPVTRRPSHSRLLHTTQTTRPLTPRNRPLHQAIPRPTPPPHHPRRPRCFDIGVSEPTTSPAWPTHSQATARATSNEHSPCRSSLERLAASSSKVEA